MTESSARRVISGFLTLAFASVLGQAIGFAALAIAARKLGPDDLGAYNFALSTGLYFALAADFGVTVLAIRDVAREPERVREIAGEVLVLQTIFACVLWVVLAIIAPFIAPTDEAAALLPIAAATVLVANAVTLHWALRALQEMRKVAVAELLGQIVYGALVPLLVIDGLAGAKRYAYLALLGAVITAIATIVSTVRHAGAPRIRLDVASMRRRMWLSLPIGISFAMIKIYYSIDSVMLGYLKSVEDVGQYAVAYKLPLALIGFGTIWVSAFYPHASSLSQREPGKLREQVDAFSSIAVVVALGIGVGATLSADGLMAKLFGDDFDEATTPYILLMWAAAIILISVNFGNVLLACGDEKRYAIGVSAGAVANLAINFWAIPAYGTAGAAWATIAAEVLVLAYMVRRFSHVLGRPQLEWGRIARGALATGVMAGALVALPDSADPLIAIGVGAVTWVVAAVALGVVSRSEIAALRRRGAPA